MMVLPTRWSKKLTKSLVILLFTLSAFCSSAQRLRVIGPEQGLSSRQTVQTRQDKFGFIWVATKTGVDRLDGNSIKSYELPQIKSQYACENYYISTDRDSLIWAFNDIGQIFQFSYTNNRFELFFNLNMTPDGPFYWLRDLHFATNNNLYLGTDLGLVKITRDKTFFLYQENALRQIVVGIEEIDKNTLAIATFNRLFLVSLTNDQLAEIDLPASKTLRIQSLCFNDQAQTIWVGSFSDGVYYYNLATKTFGNLESLISNIPKVPIRSLVMADTNKLMIGADGQGVWVIDTQRMVVEKVYSESNAEDDNLSSNGVYDIFIDKENRIWVCTYAGGLNVFEAGWPNFRILRNIPLNNQSLGNNGVNAILEDSRGNIWFGTNNGLSILTPSNQWVHLFKRQGNNLDVFLALCEDEFGNIWAGTYSQGVFVINKNFQTIEHLISVADKPETIGTNYVFSLFMDNNKTIWIGGRDGFLSNVERLGKKITRILNMDINAITAVAPNRLLIGGPQTSIILNTQNNQTHTILSGQHVNSLFVDEDSIFYHATRGGGLLVFDKTTNATTAYTTAKGLSSNYVNHILSNDNQLWLSTENGLSRFDKRNHTFTNFLMDDGLSDKSFNRASGCKLKNGQFLFGSNNGVTWFDPNKISDREISAEIFLEELRLFNQTMSPDMSKSPLKKAINATDTLVLKHSQHSFSIRFTSISFFNAEKVKNAWRLKGFDDQWSIPSFDKTINYTNIPPGDYNLEFKVVDHATGKVLDKRSIAIVITPPFWKTIWAIVLYVSTFLLLMRWLMLYMQARVDKKHSDEKIAFFTNAAHDLRTPLSLVNAPLNELKREERLTDTGKYYLSLALANVDKFNKLVNQLLDFQKSDSYHDQLTLSEIEINTFLMGQISIFRHLAASKNVLLNFHPFTEPLFEWVDLSKLEKIIENLLSNAIKYTPDGGTVNLSLHSGPKSWSIICEDTGIGIPKKSQRKLFKAFYRGENAINSQVIGTGIGLLLIKKYVEIHRGKIIFQSTENEGSTFNLVFKHGKRHYPTSANFLEGKNEATIKGINFTLPDDNAETETLVYDKKKPMVLIVEDNEDLRKFLQISLQELYNIGVAENGEMALEIIKKNQPDVVVTDVKMPIMDGIALSRYLKNDLKTSHIPIIILSALSEKEDLFMAFDTQVDDYITKPFDITILKFKIRNLILSREIIKKRILTLAYNQIEANTIPNPQDQRFVEKVFSLIQANISDSNFSVASFASGIGVSKTVLYDKLNALVGQTPNDFLKTMRIKHAMKLLTEGTYNSIGEVATFSGFDDPRYFSTCFKSFYGKSPSSYLKKNG